MRHIYLFCLFAVFYISIYAQPKQEVRAAWITTAFSLDWPGENITGIEKQQRELIRILNKLKEANFNTVFFQVRSRGDVVYNSRFEPVCSNVAVSTQYDPLSFAVEECHKRGMELHAWFTPYNLGRNSKSPTVCNNSDIVKLCKTTDSKNEYFFDPGNPQTNYYLISLIKEIVYNYDIDGFHFDRIRYPDTAGYFDDSQTFRKYGRYNQNTKEWRRENINNFVYAAYDAIKAIKPWVQVSSAVVGVYSSLPSVRRPYMKAYDDALQDPADWLRKGKHDFIVPMMYYTNDLFLPSLYNWIDYSYGRFVVPGLGIFKLDEKEGNWSPEWIINQIQYSRKNNAQGNAFYRTFFLTENKKGIMDELARSCYTNPALLYPLTWLRNTPPPPPQNPVIIKNSENAAILQWEERKKENSEKVFYNIYYSTRTPVDTSDPKNLLATRLDTTSVSIKYPVGYYFVVTSYDRYHNESASSKEVRI
jgi:uncharacterized lipoprotein YddW (UPF0748 family)